MARTLLPSQKTEGKMVSKTLILWMIISTLRVSAWPELQARPVAAPQDSSMAKMNPIRMVIHDDCFGDASRETPIFIRFNHFFFLVTMVTARWLTQTWTFILVLRSTCPYSWACSWMQPVNPGWLLHLIRWRSCA